MEIAELQTTASELRSLAGRILKAARQDTEQRLIASRVDISTMQYGILYILKEKKHTLSELSGVMGREPATLLPAVDSLEVKKMLRRGKDSRDRRRIPLTITRQGLAVLERVPQAAENDLLLNALKGLGDQKAKQLISLMNEVTLQVVQDKNITSPKVRKTKAESV